MICFDASEVCEFTMVIILAATAAWFDLRKNIIPNKVVFSGMGIGILFRTAAAVLGGKPPDILMMAAEVIVLFICLWPFYVAGGLGAGDCKLLLLAGVFLPAKQAIFVVAGTFFIAAIGIIVLKKKKSIPLAPAFFLAVSAGGLWGFAGM